MALPYSWLTLATARMALGNRLADPSSLFWSDTEKGNYLAEALRTWNALTEQWNADFAFTATSSSTWYNLATQANSPRLRTVTDAQVYKDMQYALLEPATGAGAWAGTSQFSLNDLRYALQRRRDEIIQMCSCNLGQIAVASQSLQSNNARRAVFPDTVLEPRRVRFIPASGLGNPVTLTREDTEVFEDFEPDYLQTPGIPASWSVVSEPPLSMDVDIAPNVAGRYDVIALQSGPIFAPPAATLMGLPDDWCWLAKWGAMADLFNRESEATDRMRADYCLSRYWDGLKILHGANWLVSAELNGVPCDTPALEEADDYLAEWEQQPGVWPAVVQAGMDFVAPCPVVAGSNVVGVGLTLVGSIPVPVNDGDFIQCGRDVWDVILGYAQRLASFKQGGEEFASTKPLEDDFFRAAEQTNTRIKHLGLYSDVLRSAGKKQDELLPRE